MLLPLVNDRLFENALKGLLFLLQHRFFGKYRPDLAGSNILRDDAPADSTLAVIVLIVAARFPSHCATPFKFPVRVCVLALANRREP